MARYKKKSGCLGTIIKFYMFPFMLMGWIFWGMLKLIELMFSGLYRLLCLIPMGSKGVSNGHDYEIYVANWLKRKGYRNVKVTKGSGDYGVDVIAEKRRKKYGIQCKYYSNPVGVKAVQEAYSGGSFYNCHYAIVASNNTYTSSAQELANKLGVGLWTIP